MSEAPGRDEVREVEADGEWLCLANVAGELRVLQNECPHRQGPLGQGWVEGQTVVCPWHAWAFDCRTGIAEAPEKARVKVFAVQTQGDQVLAYLG